MTGSLDMKITVGIFWLETRQLQSMACGGRYGTASLPVQRCVGVRRRLGAVDVSGVLRLSVWLSSLCELLPGDFLRGCEQYLVYWCDLGMG